MRRTTLLALMAALALGAGSLPAIAQTPTEPAGPATDAQPLLQASPSPLPPEASPLPDASADPCPSPAPSLEPGASLVPSSPAPSLAPSPVASAPALSPAPSALPSAEPTIDPCATVEPVPSEDPGTGSVKPGKLKLKLKKVVDGLQLPVYATGTGDGTGRLFVVERAGRVLILDPETGKTKPFLDIRSKVDTLNERGLHAIALDPDYAQNGHFYVHFNGPDGDTQVVRYTAKPGKGKVKTSTAKPLLRFNQPYENHNGGWLGFGPDGMLYLALGDGGGNDPGDPLGNGQKKSQPLAKILRVDPQTGKYTTYAWGLRNPWRASFDRETGDLWIGDVGQKTIEEIDVVKADRKSPPNFGWSVMEGSLCHRGACDKNDYVLPVTEYTHANGCSVVGGYVYRGQDEPALQGTYLFSDFCSGRIWGIKAADGKPGADLKPRPLFQTNASTFVSFGEDDDGELYAVSFGGAIYKVGTKAKGGGGGSPKNRP